MMDVVAGRRWVWAGIGVTVMAVAGLGSYFVAVGLDEADKLASVVGGLSALMGLATTAYGLFGAPGGRQVSQQATASGRGRVTQVGGNQTTPNDQGGGSESDVPSRVTQDAKAISDGCITQVGGDQIPPNPPNLANTPNPP
ncbi:hypothetical protein [Nonomuraea wenchangensis]|uniref:hypothetical protein n=1 Tax=Nonomuraea wenchangensis TaxID=568860 RepID=UPI00379134C2